MRELTSQSTLASIEKLLQNRNYREAISKAKDIDYSQLSAEDDANLGLLFSEANLWLRNVSGDLRGKEIEELLQQAIAYYKANYKNHDNVNRLARAKYLLGWLYSLKGKFFEAQEELLESYSSYKLCNNISAIPKVLNRLANSQFSCGAINDAISNLQRCVDIYRKINKPSNILIINHNIALILLVSGKLGLALQKFNDMERDTISRDQNFKAYFYTGYSLVLALKGNLDKANKLTKKARSFDAYKLESAVLVEYMGWIRNLEGRFNEAIEYFNEALLRSKEFGSESDLISQSKRLLADAYVGLEKYDLAQKTAEESLLVAEKINERSEIAGCYRVFAQVAVHNGEKEKAIEYYKKAVDIFKLIQSRYELAVTRYLMATSGLFDNGERMALLYLAREYFVSEEIEHFIQKVDAAITKYRSTVSSVTDKTPHSMASTQTVFIASHPKIRKIVEFAENVAESNMTVFLTGPTGSGKDHLARYIHEYSGRKGEFVTVNCAAIPETMIESELFGYRKGAFTGADQDRQGLFEAADGGTFYLNEIADASPVFQAKLLEVIEKKAIRRLGENKSRPVGVRIIAATNHDLEVRIKENKFRFDLYHRLNEIPITLPPLDDRKEDIPELIKHFLGQNGCDIKGNIIDLAELGNILKERSWPGNVRQLKAEIDRMCLTTKGDLAAMVGNLQRGHLSDRDLLFKTLEETGWNRRETARLLNMSEGTVRYKIRKFNLFQ